MIFGWICDSCELEMGFGLKYNSPQEDSCPVCGSHCSTGYLDVKAPTFSLDPISGDHLIATAKWEKHRNKQMAKEKKNMENHGTYD